MEEKHHWVKRAPRKGGCTSDMRMAVKINKKRDRLIMLAGIKFPETHVDVFDEAQGMGKGIKIAIVPSNTGAFTVRHYGDKDDARDKPRTRYIACKLLIQEDWDIPAGTYDVSIGSVIGKKAFIFNAFVNR
jgi:hypothetical protein